MDDLKEKFIAALKAAVTQAGSQTELAKQAGMQQSRISDYLNSRYDLDNITVGVLRRIFPGLKIDFGVLPENAQDQGYAEAIEKRLIALFHSLSTEDQIRCFEMVSRTFGDKFKEEEK